MEDSYRYTCSTPETSTASVKEFNDSQEFHSTDSKQHLHVNLHEKSDSSVKDQSNVDFPNLANIHRDTNLSKAKSSQNQTTCNDSKKNLKEKGSKLIGCCSHCQSSCEEKHGYSSSPLDEKPPLFEPPIDDPEEEEANNGCSTSEEDNCYLNSPNYNIDELDLDAKFVEEVCKQRESAEGWDTYLKLLSDRIQDDSDDNDLQDTGDVHDCSYNDSQHQSRSFSAPNTYDRTKEFTKPEDEEKKPRHTSYSFLDSSYKNKTNFNSENKSTSKSPKKSPKEGEKERLFFMNGTGYYGIPPFNSNAADDSSEVQPKSKPASLTMDPSESDFYRNLRSYFVSEKSEPKKSTLPSTTTFAETSHLDSSPSFSRSTNTCSTSYASEPNSLSSPRMVNEEESLQTSKQYATATDSADRSSPFVVEEKADIHIGSNIHHSGAVFEEPQLEKEPEKEPEKTIPEKTIPVKSSEKLQMPKTRTSSSDRKGKKAHKNRVILQEDNTGEQPTTKSKLNKKHKQKFPESNKEKEKVSVRTTKMSKEEMIKRISISDDLKEWNWQSGMFINSYGCAMHRGY
jgi:hypothetical protein